MSQITVKAKGDFGFSPKFGEIRKDQEYTIEETDFAPELFKAPKGFDVTPYLPKVEPVEEPETLQVFEMDGSVNTLNKEVL